jgi:probable phosphoglycerate mutase
MPTVLLVRHGSTDVIGRKVTGRLPGIWLDEIGRGQVRALAEHLATRGVSAIYSSPTERALETANAIARRLSLDVVVRPRLDELDFGEWSGLSLAELDSREDWKRFNVNRTGTRAPRGEHILDVQHRMVAEVEALRDNHADGAVVLVSHGDPLKTVIAYYLGLSLELLPRLEISPASVSELVLSDWGATLRSLNFTLAAG